MTLKELREIINSIDKKYDNYSISSECECLGFEGNYYINEDTHNIDIS